MKFALLFSLLVLCFSAGAQSNAQEFHNKVNEYIFSDPEIAEKYASKELKATKIGTEENVIAQIDVAKCKYYADYYQLGEKLLQKALSDAKKISYQEGIAWASFHIGDLRILEGKYGTAIQYLNSSYNLFVQLDCSACKEGEALSLNAIGLIYLDQEDFQKAESFFQRALKTGNEITKGDSHTNLAQLYVKMEAYPKAKHYANLALNLANKNEDEYVKSTALDVLGAVAMVNNEFFKAELYFFEAIQTKEHLQDHKGASASYLQLALIKQKMGAADKSFEYMMKAYRLADNVGASLEIRDAAYQISKHYARKALYDSAFYYQNKFVELNQNLMNEQVQKKIAQIEEEKAKKENELRISKLENQKRIEQETTSFYLLLAIGGVILLLGAAYLFYYRYKVKQKSFESLEAKNKVIEGQNQHILESIRYAQRIQEAILPRDEVLQASFKNIFTIYLPKDIVAGDFYWYEEVNDFKILACCDSTGHGVPGAMVSVVCSNALNSAVLEMGLTNPGKILDATRARVIENFNRSGSVSTNVKDGMDIALIAIQKSTGEISFSGAHHALWVYRASENKFDIYKGDKQPIGLYEKNNNYVTQKIEATIGDRLFMFTDGYADQFGGKDLKKLKNANVLKFLEQIQTLTIAEQERRIIDFFSDWKGLEEQIDDVTVIGVEL